MGRLAFIGSVVLGLFTATAAANAQPAGKTPPGAEGQPTGRIHRIGYVWSGSPGSDPAETGGLRQGLRELGWVEGRNVALEFRYARGDLERVPLLIAELIKLNVAVIVTAGTPVTAAATRGARDTPVVFVVNDPVVSGFVQSLARPGGNATGVSFGADAGFSGKWLDLIKETLTKASVVKVIWNPTNRSNAAAVKELERLAPGLGVQLSSHPAQSPRDIEAAFATLKRGAAAAAIIPNDPFLTTQRLHIVRLATAKGVPTVAGLRYFVEDGALMSYGPSLFKLFRRAAYFVDKILKGARPADLPVEEPTTFELVVNLKTARALGLTIPPSVLLRADQVLE